MALRCVVALLVASTVQGLVVRGNVRRSTLLLSASTDADKSSAVSTFASDSTPSPLKSSSDNGELDLDFDSLASESAAKAFTPKTDLSSMYVKQEDRKTPRMAKWFPMLLSPTSLDGTYAGDVGFDPLGLSADGRIVKMREAEIKHARLAMLAAAGWPLSELWHKDFAKALGLDDILVGEGKAPSVLNGGLTNEWVILSGVLTLAIGGFLEFKSFEMSQKAGYRPGDYGFDPLGELVVLALVVPCGLLALDDALVLCTHFPSPLPCRAFFRPSLTMLIVYYAGLYALRASFGLDRVDIEVSREEKLASGKADMELCEIKNGRLAMIAITVRELLRRHTHS